MVLHGAPLAGGTGRRVAVIVEPAHPDEELDQPAAEHLLRGERRDSGRVAGEVAGDQSLAEVASQALTASRPAR